MSAIVRFFDNRSMLRTVALILAVPIFLESFIGLPSLMLIVKLLFSLFVIAGIVFTKKYYYLMAILPYLYILIKSLFFNVTFTESMVVMVFITAVALYFVIKKKQSLF